MAADIDFYGLVLDHEEHVHKLIFLERKPLIDQHGQKINAVTTLGVRENINTWGDLIANTNFKGVLERICTRIDCRALRTGRISFQPQKMPSSTSYSPSRVSAP